MDIREDTICYFKDVEKVDDTFTRYGTLMTWSYGKTSSKIASEVITNSLDSGYINYNKNSSAMVYNVNEDVLTYRYRTSRNLKTFVNIKELYYLKYNYIEQLSGDDVVYSNLMYYDGKKIQKIATDIIIE